MSINCQGRHTQCRKRSEREIHSFYMLRWCPPEHWSILGNLMHVLENGHPKKSGNCFTQGWIQYWEEERRWGGLWYKQVALRATLCSFGEQKLGGPWPLNTLGNQERQTIIEVRVAKALTIRSCQMQHTLTCNTTWEGYPKWNIPGLQYILSQNCFSLHKS